MPEGHFSWATLLERIFKLRSGPLLLGTPLLPEKLALPDSLGTDRFPSEALSEPLSHCARLPAQPAR